MINRLPIFGSRYCRTSSHSCCRRSLLNLGLCFYCPVVSVWVFHARNSLGVYVVYCVVTLFTLSGLLLLMFSAIAGVVCSLSVPERRRIAPGEFWMYPRPAFNNSIPWAKAVEFLWKPPPYVVYTQKNNESFGCDAARDYSRSVPPYPFLCRLRV